MRSFVRIALVTAALTFGVRTAHAQETGSCGNGGCATCNSCGGSHLGPKCKKFVDWLIYVPLDHGKTKCCKGCQGCTPPAWVFFPCEGNGCRAGAFGGTVAGMAYYAKGAGATTATAGQVVQTAYPPTTAATTTPPVTEKRLSTYKPAAVAGSMPVLSPDQFRKPVPPGTCASGACGGVTK